MNKGFLALLLLLAEAFQCGNSKQDSYESYYKEKYKDKKGNRRFFTSTGVLREMSVPKARNSPAELTPYYDDGFSLYQSGCEHSCLDAQSCKNRGCFYDWEKMHCFRSKGEAMAISIEYPFSLAGTRQCENVGGGWMRDSWNYEFRGDTSYWPVNGRSERYGGDMYGDYDYRDSELFRNARHHQILVFGLDFQGGSGHLQVKLFFMENFYHWAGGRSFDIVVNHFHIIRHSFDIFSEAGGVGRPVVFSFPLSVQQDKLIVEGRHSKFFGIGSIKFINVFNFFNPFRSATVSGICGIRMFRCTNYCNNPSACNSAGGCVYDNTIRHCVSDISFTRICRTFDGKREGCLNQGCVLCPNGEECLPPALTCPTGCARFDGNVDKCKDAECIYDFDTNKCIDPKEPLPGVSLEKVCAKSNGDPPRCLKQGCTSCACSLDCVPPNLATNRCPSGCKVYCRQQELCVKHECIYDEGNGECYERNSTIIDPNKLCQRSNGDVDGCVRRGCHSCRCSKECVVPTFASNCDPGCLKYCGQSEKCAASGCRFDYDKDKCEGGNGGFRYCVNMCGRATVDSNGVWYQKWDPKKIKAENGICDHDTDKMTCTCRYRQVTASFNPADVELWKCVWESHVMQMDILVVEDGLHEILLHMSEIIVFQERTFTVSINTKEILKDLNTDYQPTLYTKFTHRQFLWIEDNVTFVEFPGLGEDRYPIVNQRLNLSLRHRGICGNAILNGVCIQKYDSTVKPNPGPGVNTTILCTQHNGNESSCRTQKCTWCPCTKICVPESLAALCYNGTGCSQYCNDQPECVKHECIYDKLKGDCYERNETNVVLPTVCAQSNGDAYSCQSQGCTPCEGCKPKCVPPNQTESCPTDCSIYCGKPVECKAAGCLFDPNSQDCLNKNDTNAGKFCAASNGNKAECYAKACTYCTCNEKCVPLFKNCDTGCEKHCYMEETCAADGCIYNYTSNKCRPSNGAFRYCVNLCGNETIDSNGVWYQRYDEQKVRGKSNPCSNMLKDFYCMCDRKGIADKIKPADVKLYECNLQSHQMKMNVLILEDGVYELILHFTEYEYTSAQRRSFNVALQGKLIAEDIDTSYFPNVYIPYVFHQFFYVEDRVGKIRFPDGPNRYTIFGNKLELQLKHKGSCGYAIINGFCIRKYDVGPEVPIPPNVNLTILCTRHNGDMGACDTEHCVWCRCSATCVPGAWAASCDPGCTKYCDQREPCVKHGCIYDYDTGRCLNITTNINLPDVCATSNGNATRCSGQGCTPCNCSTDCVVPTMTNICPSGCNQYCKQREPCVNNSCVYDYETEDCHNPTGPGGPDINKVCGQSNGKETLCKKQGCAFCRCSEFCVNPKFNDTCDLGCQKHCNNEEECAANGCIYNYFTNTCHPTNKQYRYCVNLCGVETTDSEDIWYQRYDSKKVKGQPTECRVLDEAFDCRCSNTIISPPVAPKDVDLYKCNLESYNMVMNILIAEDGMHELLLRFAEVIPTVRVRKERVFDVFLSNKQIIENFNTAYLPSLYVPYTFRQFFTVEGGMTTIRFPDEGNLRREITDRRLSLRLKHKGLCGRAILSGFCVRYYDMEVPIEPSVNVTTLCTRHNGNETGCKKEHCTWCKCTEVCLPESMADGCNSGCSQYCGDLDKCNANLCIYDWDTKICYNETTPNVNLTKICGASTGNPDRCAKQGCIVCLCTQPELCVPPSNAMRCPTGCIKHCNDLPGCVGDTEGCIYDWPTGQCSKKNETLPRVCEDTSGDTSDKCTRQGCHLCKCTEQCVLPFEKEKCPTGCIEYCGQREACKHHGCVYEEPSGICRKPTDPIAGKICSSNNNNPANCMRLGCISCPCSELCVTPSQQDICVTGCAAFCDNAERCVENGCIFDFDTKTCSNETTTLPSVCSKIVSNAPKCKKQGCHPCKCTDQCVLPRLTERCDKGCIEFCMEQQNCTSHMCIYKEANGRCYNHTDPRAREVCDKSTDSTDNICTRQGCHMCKCSYQCVLPIETFRCPKGCPEHCGQREKCVGAGCVYEDSNGNCHNATGPPAERVCRESNGKVDNCRRQGCVYCECNSLCYIPSMAANCPPTCGPSGVVIVAGNVCGEDTVGANGIEYKEDMAWHIAVDDEYDDEDIIFCHKGGVSDSAGEDRVMFSSKLECTHCVRDIPIQEGGNYDIVFHFAELKGTNNRVFSVLLNDVVLIESLHTSDIGPPGTPHSVNKMFTISMDVSKIIIGSTEAVIYDKILEARIKFFKTPGSKIGAAIVNGFYLLRRE